MNYETILVEYRDAVGWITLNRPEVLNAMNTHLMRELHTAVSRLSQDDNIGCIVITGAGDKAFSAGGDIHEQRSDDKQYSQEELDKRTDARLQMNYEISACTKPTIGMMNGLAYGGAAVLSSSLDMRIGCERTKFRFLAAAYGRINSTWTLPNQVGWPIAKELLFTARIVEGEEAYRVGLLNHLVTSEELEAKTMEIASLIANNDHDSVVGIKKLLLEGLADDLHGQWSNEGHYTRNVKRGAKAEEAFPEFITRKGRVI